jgi:hypothetical protein
MSIHEEIEVKSLFFAFSSNLLSFLSSVSSFLKKLSLTACDEISDVSLFHEIQYLEVHSCQNIQSLEGLRKWRND